MLHIDMQDVNKWFGDLHVLRDINLGSRHAASASSSAGRLAPASRR